MEGYCNPRIKKKSSAHRKRRRIGRCLKRRLPQMKTAGLRKILLMKVKAIPGNRIGVLFQIRKLQWVTRHPRTLSVGKNFPRAWLT